MGEPETANDSNELRPRHYRNSATAFKPGLSGNGREPVASKPSRKRAKLSATFVTDLHRQWERSGPKALETMAEKHPEKFVAVVASLVPKDVNVNLGLGEQLADLLERMQQGPDDANEGHAQVINGLGHSET